MLDFFDDLDDASEVVGKADPEGYVEYSEGGPIKLVLIEIR